MSNLRVFLWPVDAHQNSTNRDLSMRRKRALTGRQPGVTRSKFLPWRHCTLPPSCLVMLASGISLAGPALSGRTRRGFSPSLPLPFHAYSSFLLRALPPVILIRPTTFLFSPSRLCYSIIQSETPAEIFHSDFNPSSFDPILPHLFSRSCPSSATMPPKRRTTRGTSRPRTENNPSTTRSSAHMHLIRYSEHSSDSDDPEPEEISMQELEVRQDNPGTQPLPLNLPSMATQCSVEPSTGLQPHSYATCSPLERIKLWMEELQKPAITTKHNVGRVGAVYFNERSCENGSSTLLRTKIGCSGLKGTPGRVPTGQQIALHTQAYVKTQSEHCGKNTPPMTVAIEAGPLYKMLEGILHADLCGHRCRIIGCRGGGRRPHDHIEDFNVPMSVALDTTLFYKEWFAKAQPWGRRRFHTVGHESPFSPALSMKLDLALEHLTQLPDASSIDFGFDLKAKLLLMPGHVPVAQEYRYYDPSPRPFFVWLEAMAARRNFLQKCRVRKHKNSAAKASDAAKMVAMAENADVEARSTARANDGEKEEEDEEDVFLTQVATGSKRKRATSPGQRSSKKKSRTTQGRAEDEGTARLKEIAILVWLAIASCSLLLPFPVRDYAQQKDIGSKADRDRLSDDFANEATRSKFQYPEYDALAGQAKDFAKEQYVLPEGEISWEKTCKKHASTAGSILKDVEHQLSLIQLPKRSNRQREVLKELKSVVAKVKEGVVAAQCVTDEDLHGWLPKA